MTKVHKVDPKKITKEYALTRNIDNALWTREDHGGIFVLTIVIRLLLRHNPGLRKTRFRRTRLRIRGRWAYQSCLFRHKGELSKQFNCVDDLETLIQAMCSMHLHNTIASQDRLHQSILDIVQEPIDGARKVQLLSFFFEFAYVTQFGQTKEQLCEFAHMTPEAFANTCFDRGIVPVSPRFGQGAGGKNWHRNSVEYLVAGERERATFVALVCRIYSERVLSSEEAALVFACCQLSAAPGGRSERVVMFNAIFANFTKFGPLACKNY
jgi:hypothetical protein